MMHHNFIQASAFVVALAVVVVALWLESDALLAIASIALGAWLATAMSED